MRASTIMGMDPDNMARQLSVFSLPWNWLWRMYVEGHEITFYLDGGLKMWGKIKEMDREEGMIEILSEDQSGNIHCMINMEDVLCMGRSWQTAEQKRFCEDRHMAEHAAARAMSIKMAREAFGSGPDEPEDEPLPS